MNTKAKGSRPGAAEVIAVHACKWKRPLEAAVVEESPHNARVAVENREGMR